MDGDCGGGGFSEEETRLLRLSCFSRLGDSVYLDNAGSALHSEQQIRDYTQFINSQLMANPHSLSSASQFTQTEVDNVREMVLSFFNTSRKKYTVIFTSGATAAMKLVGECFPWSESSCYSYSVLSHNSALGIRQYALDKGAAFKCLSLEELLLHGQRFSPINTNPKRGGLVHHLTCFPAQCNFSGIQFPLSLIQKIQDESSDSCRCTVLLDAASFVSTSKLDLDAYSPDFVAISFYKIFGFPTGLGALIVRKDAASLLNKKYFGGGTVAASVATENYVRFREDVSMRFEDGTIDFMGILAIQFGFNFIKQLSIERISAHTQRIKQILLELLQNLKHSNGSPMCLLHNLSTYLKKHSLVQDNFQQVHEGPIVCFSVLDPSGNHIGYSEVETLASLNTPKILLRSGCFCNPGACELFLGLSPEATKQNYDSGHVCWDSKDLIAGKPTGALRLSIPFISSEKDISTFIQFLKRHFTDYGHLPSIPPSLPSEAISVSKVVVYPIKSCEGFVPASPWMIGENGLQYDREWTLIDDGGYFVNQKKVPRLCQVFPSISLEESCLFVNAPGMDTLKIPLEYYPTQRVDIRVCGDQTVGLAYEKEVSEWFSRFTGKKLDLIRKSPNHTRNTKLHPSLQAPPPSVSPQGPSQITWKTTLQQWIPYWAQVEEANPAPMEKVEKCSIAFANESQFLLVSTSSMEDLKGRMKVQSVAETITYQNFRPNLLITGGDPFQEDFWEEFCIGDQYFVKTGRCNRCTMICIDRNTLHIGNEPLSTLGEYRRENGKIYFGVLYEHDKTRSKHPYLIQPSQQITSIKFSK